ncbi:MAG: hypothetical protein IJY74_03020 [Oscillospiraceae bacterium]|nr:hypothetical protein [Oscillospiraceae bacterium]
MKQNKRSDGLGGLSILLAVIAALAAVAYAVCRTMENRAYDERWSEYDECGLG